MIELNGFHNCDCMDLMKELPDKYIDLAIVDPPYGIGISNNPVRQAHTKKKWDNSTPTQEYFNELFRIAKHSIIWGGNYFNLPPTQCFVIWEKCQPEDFSLAMCEFAWTDFKMPAKSFTYSVLREKAKIHPTQKPIALYEWLLSKFAKDGDIILDTHVGSASSLIACYRLGFDYIGCEIDKEYYRLAKERIEAEKAQLRLF